MRALPLAAPLLLLASPAGAVAPCAGTYLVREPDGAAAAAPDTAPDAAAKPSGKLELLAEGRFRLSLTSAGHEEGAEGRWRAADDRVILTGDPLTPPAFTLERDEPLAEPVLRIDLDLPNGLSRQFFTAAVRLADGTIVGRAFGEAPLALAVEPRNPPVALRIDVPTLALSSPDFPLPHEAGDGGGDGRGDGRGGGRRLALRFAANDLGKIAFADTPLIERDGALILPHAGGDIAFRRSGRCLVD